MNCCNVRQEKNWGTDRYSRIYERRRWEFSCPGRIQVHPAGEQVGENRRWEGRVHYAQNRMAGMTEYITCHYYIKKKEKKKRRIAGMLTYTCHTAKAQHTQQCHD